MMTFSVPELMDGVLETLKELYPQAQICKGPGPADPAGPCFSVSFTSVKTGEKSGGRMRRLIGFEILYRPETGAEDGYGVMTETAETLTSGLRFLPCGKDAVKLRAGEREWKIADGALHFWFTAAAEVSASDDAPRMERCGKIAYAERNGKHDRENSPGKI